MNPSHLPTLMAVALSRLLLRLRSMRTLLIFEMRATCWLTLSDVFSFIYSSYVVLSHFYISYTLYLVLSSRSFFFPSFVHMSCTVYSATGDLCWVVVLLYYSHYPRNNTKIISTSLTRKVPESTSLFRRVKKVVPCLRETATR